MKIAAKVFLILGMVAVPSAALFVCLHGRGFSVVAVFALAMAAGSIIVGVFTYKKLDTAKSKNELIALGILSIFFVNILAGVFTLCVPESDLLIPVEPDPNVDQQV